MDTIIQLNTDRQLKLTSVSAREVFLKYHPLSNVEETLDSEGNIVNLTVDDYSITEESVIQLKLLADGKNRPFKIMKIKKSKRNNMYVLYSAILTKATRFIMPMLRTSNQTQTSMLYDRNFINCYVGTAGEGYIEEIYLVYRYSGSIDYRNFENELKEHELFDRMIDIDRQHVMYVFRMTQKHSAIFKQFINGDYSKFPDQYKKQILSFVVNPATIGDSPIESTLTYGILYKTDKQKKALDKLINPDEKFRVHIPDDAEVYSSPNELDEVYNGDIELPLEAIESLNESEEEC
jgi:hypothetical protein